MKSLDKRGNNEIVEKDRRDSDDFLKQLQRAFPHCFNKKTGKMYKPDEEGYVTSPKDKMTVRISNEEISFVAKFPNIQVLMGESNGLPNGYFISNINNFGIKGVVGKYTSRGDGENDHFSFYKEKPNKKGYKEYELLFKTNIEKESQDQNGRIRTFFSETNSNLEGISKELGIGIKTFQASISETTISDIDSPAMELKRDIEIVFIPE